MTHQQLNHLHLLADWLAELAETSRVAPAVPIGRFAGRLPFEAERLREIVAQAEEEKP